MSSPGPGHILRKSNMRYYGEVRKVLDYPLFFQPGESLFIIPKVGTVDFLVVLPQ